MPGIVAIWIKRAHRGPMDAADEAELVAGRGVAGSADQGGRGQITILDEAAWDDACREVGTKVDPSKRRANVMVRGLTLEGSRGRRLRLGSCVIHVWGEARPCERMDEAHPGLRKALGPHWRAGIFGEIVEGGTVRAGDPAEWIDE